MQRRALSLVELLVVLAILGLVVGICIQRAQAPNKMTLVSVRGVETTVSKGEYMIVERNNNFDSKRTLAKLTPGLYQFGTIKDSDKDFVELRPQGGLPSIFLSKADMYDIMNVIDFKVSTQKDDPDFKSVEAKYNKPKEKSKP